MTPQEIKQRWSGRAAGADVSRLVDEIKDLEIMIAGQNAQIETLSEGLRKQAKELQQLQPPAPPTTKPEDENI